MGGGRPSVIFRPAAFPHLISYPYTPVCRIRSPVPGVFRQCGREKKASEERNTERGKTAGSEKKSARKHQSAHCPTDFLKNHFAFQKVKCRNDQKVPLSSHSCGQEQPFKREGANK